MDNYNNQGQQYNPYTGNEFSYNQQQQVYGQPQYNTYVNGQSQQVTYNNPQPYTNVYETNPQVKKSLISLSMILGLLGSVILFVGLMLPAIDFSHFRQEIDIQYNLFKIGKNVGLIITHTYYKGKIYLLNI